MPPDVGRMIVMAGVVVGAVFWVLAFRMWLKVRSAPLRIRRTLGTVSKTPPEVLEGLVSLVAGKGRVVTRSVDSVGVEVGGATLTFRVRADVGGNALHAEADLAGASRAYALGLAVFVFLLQPLAITLAAALITMLALPSENPGIRAQAVQMVQIAHFLWPPFLIAHRHGVQRRAVLNLADEARVVLCDTSV